MFFDEQKLTKFLVTICDKKYGKILEKKIV